MSTVDHASLDLGGKLGKGGQGTVYEVRDRPINGRWPVVYKEYSPSILPTVRFDILTQMVDLIPSLPRADGVWLAERTSWPVTLVTKAGAPRGFLMREVPTKFRFVYHGLGNTGASRRLAEVGFLLNDDSYVAGIGLRVSERDRLLMLADFARVLDRLHRLDIAVGDLSPKNVLFSVTPKVRCFVIDCDAMRLRRSSAMPQVDTPGWFLPAGEAKATQHSDAYKFGMLAVRLLARDQMSMDTGALSRISQELGGLARDSLGDDPDGRPPPGGWIDALKAAVASASSRPASGTPRGSGRPAGGATGAAAGVRQTGGVSGASAGVTQTSRHGYGARAFTANPGTVPATPGWGPPVRPGGRRRGRAALVSTILLLAVIGLAFRYHDAHAPATGASGVSAPTVTAPSIGSPTIGGVDSAGGAHPSPQPPPQPAGPTSLGLVGLAPDLASDPRAVPVASMFDVYFGGINQKNYARALAQYDPNGVVNPQDDQQVRQFEQGVSTSQDMDVRLLSLEPSDPSSAVTDAGVTFRSTQAAGAGPPGASDETCTDWSLTYALTQAANGDYLIDNTPSASHQGC